MNAVARFLFAIGLLLSFVPTASADITRSCKAVFSVATFTPSLSKTIGSISGQGSCKNKASANDCRAAARKEIDRCIAGMWRDRQKNTIASECNTLVNGSSRAGAKLSWNGILTISEPSRLTARMAYNVCCQMRPDAGRIQARIIGQITGDKMCGEKKVGNDSDQAFIQLQNYDMDCNAWRAQGICSR